MKAIKIFGYFASFYCFFFSILCLIALFNNYLAIKYGWGLEQKAVLFIMSIMSMVTGSLYFYFTKKK